MNTSTRFLAAIAIAGSAGLASIGACWVAGNAFAPWHPNVAATRFLPDGVSVVGCEILDFPSVVTAPTLEEMGWRPIVRIHLRQGSAVSSVDVPASAIDADGELHYFEEDGKPIWDGCTIFDIMPGSCDVVSGTPERLVLSSTSWRPQWRLVIAKDAFMNPL